MAELPAELRKYAAFLDAQTELVRETFQYCLCLILVETGKMQLVETVPDNSGIICTFETVTGDRFSIAQPQINKEQEAALINMLKNKLDVG